MDIPCIAVAATVHFFVDIFFILEKPRGFKNGSRLTRNTCEPVARLASAGGGEVRIARKRRFSLDKGNLFGNIVNATALIDQKHNVFPLHS